MAIISRQEITIFNSLTLLAVLCLATPQPVQADFAEGLDKMALERYNKVREVERYQLKIAEGYYIKKDWKVAAGEYEKFLTLYESSEAASHAQLRWSICQVHLRKLNTAVTDGFQSVIDYFPDTPEATSAEFLMGRCYKEMGEIKNARKVYKKVLTKNPKHQVSVFALVDMLDIATVEEDDEGKIEILQKLTFEADRSTRTTQNHCASAARALGIHYLNEVAFEKAVEAFETTWKTEPELLARVGADVITPVATLCRQTGTQAKGEELATKAIAFFKDRMPTDLSEEAAKNQAIQAWYAIINVHNAAGQETKVPEVYAQMEKMFGVSDDILGRLAGWYQSKKRYEEARKTYRRFANKVDGLSLIAQSYRGEEKYDEAVKVYNELAGLDPEMAVKWKGEMGNTYRDAKQYDQAVGVFQELVKQDALNAGKWLWSIAYTYELGKKLKEAIGAYRQSDNFPENYKRMAGCHRQLKEYSEARALYAQIATSHEGSAPWALYMIGDTFELEQNKAKAITSFQTVCKRFPKDTYASRAHALLQSKYNITVTLGGSNDN